MKFSDSHTDFFTEINSALEREKYLKTVRLQGVRVINCAIYTTNKGFTLEDLNKFSKEIKMLNKKLKIKVIFSLEDLACVDLKQINNLISLYPFSATLTWNDINQYAGGSLTNVGILKSGMKCIKMLEEYNILIDTAHLSKKGFWQFCKITRFPIYNSHSNIYAIKHHQRNLTDNQIAKIVKTNGYLGLTFYHKFISNRLITSKEIAMQFDYLIKRFGHKNFGLGTDFFGINTLPKDVSNYMEIKNIAIELKRLGYSKKIINCLMYKNFKDFIKRIEKIKYKSQKSIKTTYK